MPEDTELNAVLPVGHLVLAAVLAVLLTTIIGSLLGVIVWPVLAAIARRANQALSLVTVAVDCSAALLSFWVFGVLSAVRFANTGGRALFYRNRMLFPTSRLASLLLALTFFLQLISFELRGLFIRYVGTYAEMNMQAGAWVLFFGVALPVALFFGVLVLGAWWSERSKWPASNSG